MTAIETMIHKKIETLKESQRNYIQKNNLLIYTSKKGLGLNLNCVVKNSEGKVINCLELVNFLVRRENGLKDYHHDLGNKENLYNAFTRQSKDKIDITSSNYYYIFDLKKIGESIYIQANKLDDDTSIKYRFLSTNHAMLIEINKKSDKAFGSYYVLKFYDPSKTDQHIRVIAKSPKDFKKLNISDLIDKYKQFIYFSSFPTGMFLSSDIRELSEEPIIEFDEKENPKGLLAFLMATNTLYFKRGLFESLITNNKLAENEFRIFGHDGSKVNVLVKAISDNFYLSVNTYLKTILASSFKSAKKASLLSTYIEKKYGYFLQKDKSSPLFQRMTADKLEIFFDYINQILDSNLEDKDKYQLIGKTTSLHLSPFKTFELSVFGLVLDSKIPEVIEKFYTLILCSNLSPEYKTLLLEKDSTIWFYGLTVHHCSSNKIKKEMPSLFSDYRQAVNDTKLPKYYKSLLTNEKKDNVYISNETIQDVKNFTFSLVISFMVMAYLFSHNQKSTLSSSFATAFVGLLVHGLLKQFNTFDPVKEYRSKVNDEEASVRSSDFSAIK